MLARVAWPQVGLIAAVSAVGVCAPAAAETLVVQGHMAGRMVVEIVERYDPAPGTNWLSLRSHRTPSFASATWSQRVVADDASYSVPPSRASLETDPAGNTMLVERWESPAAPLHVVRRVVVDSRASLEPVPARSSYPIAGAISADAARFLRPTALVQSDAEIIKERAARLTAGVRSEREAVSALLNHVVDHLRYDWDPPAHDAVSAMRDARANCQGYAHLSLALLRAAGIPARIAVGLSLAKGWRVPYADGTLTMKLGQGRHAWIEVFYPDAGWVAYDPQTSHLFVSIYHVRQAVGLDARETLGTITASPALPAVQESIRGDGSGETFELATVGRTGVPRNFLVSSVVRDRVDATAPAVPGPAPMPPAVSVPAERLTRLVEFGNIDFPAALRIFAAPEDSGAPGVVRAGRTFMVETAEYATGAEEFAQAFRVDEPVRLAQISLALQKFGGRTGDLWLEIFDDRGRKPGARIGETRRLPVGALVERGGYRWVVFDVEPAAGGRVLAPGRYWAALRSSGDAIFNWYFSLGNAYGDPDDSRSRPRGGTDWSNVLNYRFNFRVTGLVKP